MYQDESISRNYRSKSYIVSKRQRIKSERCKVIPIRDTHEEKLDDIIFGIEQALQI